MPEWLLPSKLPQWRVVRIHVRHQMADGRTAEAKRIPRL